MNRYQEMYNGLLKMKKTKGEQIRFLNRNKSKGKNKIIISSDFSMNFEKK
jgi:hypothetical protein